jgi:poly(3-hydroxybutyrate) depolymerase
MTSSTRPFCGKVVGVDRPRLACTLALAFVVAGCGGTSSPPRRPSLFSYDAAAPLRYVDRGRVNVRTYPLAVHDVSYSSGGRRVEGYLVLPPGRRRHAAVVFVHGAGGDRSELLRQAGWLAARNVVTLTITAPSTSARAAASTPAALLAETRTAAVADVVAVRRAVDLLRSLPVVDPARIGYVGWSAGARTGTLLAAFEPRLRALVLLSAGAARVSAYVAAAPPSFRAQVRRVFGSIDPLRYVARARPGSLLLEDGRRDEIVPRYALLNVIHAAPRGTAVRWYDTRHALDRKAYRDAFAWLARKLSIVGPPVHGAVVA